jgi:hypothetical protein
MQLLVALLPVEQPPAPLPFKQGLIPVPLAQEVLALLPAQHLFCWLPNCVPNAHAAPAGIEGGSLRSKSCGFS